jgi:hypothetical protein
MPFSDVRMALVERFKLVETSRSNFGNNSRIVCFCNALLSYTLPP